METTGFRNAQFLFSPSIHFSLEVHEGTRTSKNKCQSHIKYSSVGSSQDDGGVGGSFSHLFPETKLI